MVKDDAANLLRLEEELRRTQLHLACVVESVGDIVVSTDLDGVITTWNAAAETSTGYSFVEVRGAKFATYIEEPKNLEVEACFRDIAQTGDRRSGEWPMRRRSGEAIPVSWRVSRMTGHAGEVLGVVIVGRNLAEQRSMEAQMRQGEKLAALGMVIGGIAHEIRSPLGVSSAVAQLMKDSLTSPDLLEECVDKVIAGIDRAALIVESLLRFARPEPVAETTKVDIIDVLQNALTFASGEAAAGMTVEWSPPVLAGLFYAEGVQTLLEVVLLNLIQNAFQAMPDGGRLTVAVRREGADVVVEIHDTGPGIPEAHVSKIFEPFFTTRRDSRRVGLGLSVSHSIVRQHGGSVIVGASSGAGANFIVRLPAARKEA